MCSRKRKCEIVKLLGMNVGRLTLICDNVDFRDNVEEMGA